MQEKYSLFGQVCDVPTRLSRDQNEKTMARKQQTHFDQPLSPIVEMVELISMAFKRELDGRHHQRKVMGACLSIRV